MDFQARDYFLGAFLDAATDTPRTSDRRVVLNYSRAPLVAKLLRLVSATQPRSGERSKTCGIRVFAAQCLA